MREVASGPLLYGRGEDVPARGKQHPLAFGTEFDLLDEVGGGDIAGPAVDTIVGHAHGDVYALARFHIEDLQLAVEFVDDALLAVARGPSHIPQRVVGDLPGFAAGGVVRVDVEVAVAIRVVVDLLADPHGVAAGARTFGDALGGVRFGVEDVNLVVIAPARRQWALRRIEGQLLGLAAIRGHDVDLLIAVVLAGERDPLAIGRELREQLDAGVRGESRGRAACRVDQPEVAAVGEYDAVIVDVRKAEELGLRGHRRSESQE